MERPTLWPQGACRVPSPWTCFRRWNGCRATAAEFGCHLYVSVEVQLIGDVGLFLTGMEWSKLFRELVCLDHLDVGQLESYLRCQWTDAPQEGIGCLIARDVVAVQSLPCRGFVHFCHVGRDIFLLSASWTSFLHLRAPRSVLTYACRFLDESSSVYWN